MTQIKTRGLTAAAPGGAPVKFRATAPVFRPMIPVFIPQQQQQQQQQTQEAPVQPDVVSKWENYMGEGTLEDWQRLMHDLGFKQTFPSKTQCKKVLKHVWVNIPDFLEALEYGQTIFLFQNEGALARYTHMTGRFYPKKFIKPNCPLRYLLAFITHGGPKGGNAGRNVVINNGPDGLEFMMQGMSLGH